MENILVEVKVRKLRQHEGVEYFETLAPAPAWYWMYLLGSIACESNCDFCDFDAEEDLMQSSINTFVFMCLPEGCARFFWQDRLPPPQSSWAEARHDITKCTQITYWFRHRLCMKSLGLEECLADA